MKAKRRRSTRSRRTLAASRTRQPNYGRALLVVGVLAAFLAGALVSGYVAPDNARADEEALAVQPAVYRTAVPAQRAVYQEPRYNDYEELRPTRRGRSWEREVLIVAGSAGAGAAIGGVAGGGKGAAIGALSGGVAGLVYDLATRDRVRQER